MEMDGDPRKNEEDSTGSTRKCDFHADTVEIANDDNADRLPRSLINSNVANTRPIFFLKRKTGNTRIN